MPDAQEAFADLEFPQRGVDLSHAYGAQSSGTTVVGQNVRTFEKLTGRGRGGERQGTFKFVAEQLPLSFNESGTRVIQDLNYIVDPTVEATLNPYIDYGPNLGGLGILWYTGQVILDLAPPAPYLAAPPPLVPTSGVPGGFDPFVPPPPPPPLDYNPWPGWISIDPGTFYFEIPPGYEYPTDSGQGIREGGSGAGFNADRRQLFIDWDDPADMQNGDVLGDTQLDAVARDVDTNDEVPGTYGYTPSPGTIMRTGQNQDLYVRFEPTDGLTYANAQKTVQVDVNAVSTTITFVQSKKVEFANAAEPWVQSYTSDVAAGDLLVAFVGLEKSSAFSGAVAVTDSLGQTWTQVGTTVSENLVDVGAYYALSVWCVLSATGGPCAVTVTNGETVTRGILLLQYHRSQGTWTSDGFVTHTSPTLSATLRTGTIPVTESPSLALGCVANDGSYGSSGVGSPSSPFTLRLSAETGAPGSMLVVDHLAAASDEECTVPINGGATRCYVAIGVSFKKA